MGGEVAELAMTADNLMHDNGIVIDHSLVTWETNRMCCRGPDQLSRCQNST